MAEVVLKKVLHASSATTTRLHWPKSYGSSGQQPALEDCEVSRGSEALIRHAAELPAQGQVLREVAHTQSLQSLTIAEVSLWRVVHASSAIITGLCWPKSYGSSGQQPAMEECEVSKGSEAQIRHEAELPT